MGMVYACRKRGAPEMAMVAVKVLFRDLAHGDKVQAARFRKEIFAAFGVDHPNVVKAWEYIRDGDIVAYSMELITGGDLATKLGKNSPLFSIPQCVKLLTQMCAGVQAIHDAGIVHRDLKPENILLTEDGEVKIADFGIARIEVGSPRNLTENRGVVGTIDYVAPEYLMSSQIDARADIYAMGVLGYEMITGESPFRGDTVYDTLWKRVEFSAPPPSEKRPECSSDLDAIIKKALAIKPEDRFQTARDMHDELQALPKAIFEISKPFKESGESNLGISKTEPLEERQSFFTYPYGSESSGLSHKPQFQALHPKQPNETVRKKEPSKLVESDRLTGGIEEEDRMFLQNPSAKGHHHPGLNRNVGKTPNAAALSQLEPDKTRDRANNTFSASDLLLLLITTVIVIGLGLILELFEVFPIPH
jgi:serine/threonine protein kinase